jgi:hypothetical protein
MKTTVSNFYNKNVRKFFVYIKNDISLKDVQAPREASSPPMSSSNMIFLPFYIFGYHFDQPGSGSRFHSQTGSKTLAVSSPTLSWGTRREGEGVYRFQ